MSEKYIDLRQAIFRDLRDRGRPIAVSIGDVLEWLDEHPDQVPGRTITVSELRERSHYMTDNEHVTFMEGVSVAGGRVVPDPEPTNAEKWEAFILKEIRGNPHWDASTIATAIDEAGAASPGGE